MGTHLPGTLGPWELAGECSSHLNAACSPHLPGTLACVKPASGEAADGNLVEGLRGRVREEAHSPYLVI